MTRHITIDPSIDYPLERQLEVVANHSIPGETVRLNAKLRFSGEGADARQGRVDLFGDRELTVKELRLDATADGPVLSYRFEGVEGLHNIKAFQNPEGFEQDYGVLIHREGETWFVPIKDGKEPTVGEAKRVAPVMNRCGHYHFGMQDEILQAYGQEFDPARPTVEEYLAKHEAEPAAGEYALSPLPDGTWRLDASPWMSSTSEKEVELAEEAIAAVRSAPSPR